MGEANLVWKIPKWVIGGVGGSRESTMNQFTNYTMKMNVP